MPYLRQTRQNRRRLAGSCLKKRNTLPHKANGCYGPDCGRAAVRKSRLVQGNGSVHPIRLFSCVNLLHNQAVIYGYAWVSAGGQSQEAQVRQFRAGGAEKVFREVASEAKTNRPQFRRLLVQIGPGDVLMVTRLDRLARSTRDLLTPSRRSPARTPDFVRSQTRGRHDDGARALHADRARRAGRVRGELIDTRTGEAGDCQEFRARLGGST